MRFTITFKTPDALNGAVDDVERENFDSDEAFEEAQLEVRELAAKYLKYGELVTLEFDTDTEIVQVLEC